VQTASEARMPQKAIYTQFANELRTALDDTR
jgi:hypothetical protein